MSTISHTDKEFIRFADIKAKFARPGERGCTLLINESLFRCCLKTYTEGGEWRCTCCFQLMFGSMYGYSGSAGSGDSTEAEALARGVACAIKCAEHALAYHLQFPPEEQPKLLPSLAKAVAALKRRAVLTKPTDVAAYTAAKHSGGVILNQSTGKLPKSLLGVATFDGELEKWDGAEGIVPPVAPSAPAALVVPERPVHRILADLAKGQLQLQLRLT